MRLKDKVIIVTGGSGLIGQAIISRLKEEGAVQINADVAVSTSLENGERHCDIADDDSIEGLFRDVLDFHGRIDGIVNNAYPRTKDWGSHFRDIKVESWRKNVDLQLNSVFLFCKLAAAQFERQNSEGAIVNLGSMYGVVAPDFNVYEGTQMTTPAAYSAIKGGVIQFTKYLASYFGPMGIRSNCVSPGGIFDNHSGPFLENYKRRNPLGRMGHPKEIAAAVAFLLSEDASYVNGHNLVVDGGWSVI